MPDYYDAREIIQWETITLTLALSGSYAFEAAGPTSVDGTLAGEDSLILTRRAFDRSKNYDEQNPDDDPVFLTYREIRSLHTGTDGPPLLLLPATFPGSGGAGAFTKTEAGITEDSYATGFNLIAADKPPGGNWGDPETIFVQVFGAALFTSGIGAYFRDGLDLVTDPLAGLTVPWRSPDLPATLSQVVPYDILAPYFSVTPAPDEVMGSGTITLSAVFA